MASVHAPTLLHPHGGEQLASPTILVQWTSPETLEDNSRPVWFEIFYTDNYIADVEPSWIALAVVPSSVNKFLWRVSSSLTSSRVRIGIRSRNSQGTRSIMSVSASNFTVNRSVLPIPRIVSPASGGRYDSTIQIIVEADRLPDRSYYELYFSSQSAGIPMSSIGQRVLVRDIPYAWVTVGLPAADDYQIHATVVGPNGQNSQTTSVTGVQIRHEGYFIVDTLPPKATVRIDGNSLYTNKKDISVTVYAEDAATDTQSLQLLAGGTPQKPTAHTGFVLSAGDGIKQVKALLQDFGANRNNDIAVFPTLVNAAPIASSQIVDFYASYFSGVHYIHFLTQSNVGISPVQNSLYQSTITSAGISYPREVGTVNGVPICVVNFLGEEYVSSIDSLGAGHIRKLLTNGWQDIRSFSAGEFATDMEVFNGQLCYGTNTGFLFQSDGTNAHCLNDGTSSLPTDGSADWTTDALPAIRKLKTDGSKLFVVFDNTMVIGIVTEDFLLYR